MKQVFVASLVVASVFSAFGAAAGQDGIFRVRDGKIVSFDEMIRDVKKANIVVVGEVHNIREHHEAQLAVIRALHESDTPLAVGLEMFRSDSDKVLDAWVRGTLTLERFLPAYYDNWREPWPFYREIFFYAREHEIPLIGLNLPDDIAKTVSRRGFSSLTREQKKRLPPGIACTVDPTYMDFIRKAYAGHLEEGGAGRRFVNFCEAQMLWDKTMAWRVVEFRKKHPGRVVVVLAGVGHAWKRGIPEQVSLQAKSDTRVIMPVVPDEIEPTTVTLEDADYVFAQ